jgi:hypothetical protein
VEEIMPRSFRWAGVALGLLVFGPSAAEALDWAPLRDVGTVAVLTTDPDGETRETTVWIAVLDDAGYVRTGSSTWGDNVVRSPELLLRAAGATHPMRVEFVEDDSERERIAQAFREKYGFSDRALSWIRGSRPKIMQLHPRE